MEEGIFYCMMHYTLYLLLFFFGLCAGSFLNVVIFRLSASVAMQSVADGEKRESVVFSKNHLRSSTPLKELSFFFAFARSHCLHCQHKLSWLDLIPVLSFVFLRGKCRYCREKISIQYPIVEIATGLLFVLILNYQLSIINYQSILQFTIFNWINLCFLLYVTCSLIIIFVYDFRHYIIPDKILFPAIIISIMYHVLSIMRVGDNMSYIIHNTLYNYFITALIASLFFFSLVFFSRGRAMGMGDAKLAFLMGLLLGWPKILVALFFAFSSGAITGILLILIYGSRTSVGSLNSENIRHYTLKSQIPFGPFLIAGTFIALFWGDLIIKWYKGFFWLVG